MRRLAGLIAAVCLAWSALALCAAPARAQDDGAEPAERLTGGDALKWRRPARAWPLLELDRFDRDRLGPDPDRPDLQSETDFDLLWPLFGYHNAVYDTAQTVRRERGYFYALPVWWNSWSGDRATYTLFPLFTWWDRPGKPGLTVYPALFDLDVWDGGFELDFPWPLAQVRSSADRWHSRVWPVWWAGADDDEWYWSVFPLFGAWRRGYEAEPQRYRESGFFTPAGGAYAHPRGHYAMATPLYHDWRDGDERGRLLLPLFLHYTDDRTHALVTPLASFVRADDDLYWAVTPLYHRWRNAKHDEGADVLFPLFWNFFDGGDRFTLALPLGLWWRDGGTAVNAVGPVWSAHTRRGHASGGVFPVVWYLEDEARRSVWLWPAVGWAVDYDRGKGGDRLEWRRAELHLAWPFIQTTVDRDGDWDQWLGWPSVWFGARGETSWFNVAPALYTSSDAAGVRAEIAPLLIAPVGSWINGHEDFFLGVLWPWGLNLSVDEDETSFWLAWPALRWWHNSDGDWTFRLLHEGLAIEREDDRLEWRVLYRFLRYRSTDDTFLFEFNPFFRYQSEGADWHFSLFMGAYQVWTHGDRLRHQLFWSIEW